MLHMLPLVASMLALGSFLFWFSRRSLRSKKVCLRAQEELRLHGRARLGPPPLRRLLGLGPLALDPEGLVVHRRRTMDRYAWADVPEPFVCQPGRRLRRITFQHRRRNPSHGRRRLFGNTRDEFITVRRTITSAYGLGWDDLLGLLNEGRVRTVAAPDRLAHNVPLPAAAERSAPSQGRPQSPGLHFGRQSIPAWAIKGVLGIAVAVAFGCMLSSFSWMSGPAVGYEPAYAYGGGGGGGGVSFPPRPGTSDINPEQHVARGYYRSNGTYVAPHMATNPDRDRTNNLSSQGNTNPYTGARGHR